ncbi:MAG: GntR family transcriptional regulator [Pseudomonadota bacterium]
MSRDRDWSARLLAPTLIVDNPLYPHQNLASFRVVLIRFVDNLSLFVQSTDTQSNPAPRATRLLAQLQHAIVEGELAPGQKLREAELAMRFGTSRGPIRDVLRRLESQRLVTTTPNAGARVVSLSEHQLIELYQVREALEGMTCRLAAQNMSDAQVDQLGALLTTHEKEIERHEGREYFRQEGDLDFHFQIAAGCGNALLTTALCQDHYPLMRLYRRKFSAHRGRPRRALVEHQRIFAAIQERDGELAEILMRRHISAARLNIERRVRAHATRQGDDMAAET